MAGSLTLPVQQEFTTLHRLCKPDSSLYKNIAFQFGGSNFNNLLLLRFLNNKNRC